MKLRAAALLLVVLAACGGPHDSLAPAETFHWTDLPIRFAPPTSAWRREGELSGGVTGVRFIRTGGVGEGITIGEFHHVADGRNEAGQVIEERLAHWRKSARPAEVRRSSRRIGGEEATMLEWPFENDGRSYIRREVYLVHRGHLVMASFIGLKQSIPLFDRMIDSIEFPQ